MTEMVLVPKVAMNSIANDIATYANNRDTKGDLFDYSNAIYALSDGGKVSVEKVKECDEAVMELVGSSRGNLEIGAFTKVIIKSLGLDVEGGE